MHQIFLSCRAVIILTFPGRWFSYVGNALGSTRHCRHCTLGCIAYSRLLCRFSLLRPLFRLPGTQSRRPSSLNGPRLFRYLQLRYFVKREIYCGWGMVGVHWTVWNGWFMYSCCSGCGVGLPSFSVSPVCTLHNLYDVLTSVWNKWFMTSCCNVLVFPHFTPSRLSDMTLLISLMMSSYSSVYDDVLYTLLLYRFVLSIFPSWKRWVELTLLGASHRRKGSTRS